MTLCFLCAEPIMPNPSAESLDAYRPLASYLHCVEDDDGSTNDDDHEAQSWGEYF